MTYNIPFIMNSFNPAFNQRQFSGLALRTSLAGIALSSLIALRTNWATLSSFTAESDIAALALVSLFASVSFFAALALRSDYAISGRALLTALAFFATRTGNAWLSSLTGQANVALLALRSRGASFSAQSRRPLFPL